MSKRGELLRERTQSLARNIPKIEVDQRVRECEEAMLRLMLPNLVEHELCDRWEVQPNTVRKYMTRVRDSWAVAAEDEGDRVTRRNEMRMMIRNAIRLALAKKRQKITPGKKTTDVEFWNDPDLSNLVPMMKLLCQLDGLLEDNGAPDFSRLLELAQSVPKTEEETQALMDDLSEVE